MQGIGRKAAADKVQIRHTRFIKERKHTPKRVCVFLQKMVRKAAAARKHGSCSNIKKFRAQNEHGTFLHFVK